MTQASCLSGQEEEGIVRRKLRRAEVATLAFADGMPHGEQLVRRLLPAQVLDQLHCAAALHARIVYNAHPMARQGFSGSHHESISASKATQSSGGRVKLLF